MSSDLLDNVESAVMEVQVLVLMNQWDLMLFDWNEPIFEEILD